MCSHPDITADAVCTSRTYQALTLTSSLAPARSSSATFGASFSFAAISSSRSTGARPSVCIGGSSILAYMRMCSCILHVW